MFDLDKLLRRLLPIICVGVLINLAVTWYLADQNAAPDWSKFSPAYLLLAALLSLLPWFWHCVRLAIWGRFFGVKISNTNLLRIVVATDVGGTVTPQAVGGAPVKMAMLVQQGYKPGEAATLTLLGNFEDVVFYAFAIPVSLALARPWENPLWQHTGAFLEKNGLWLVGVLLAALVVFLFFRKKSFSKNGQAKPESRWQLLKSEFRAAVRLVRKKGRKAFVLSILALSAQWLTRFSILLAVLLALGLPDGLLHFFLLQWMVFVAMALVPTPGAAGGAEAAFLLVFGKIIPKSAVGPALTGWRFLTYYFMLLVGVAILWATQRWAGQVQPKIPDT
ncbi:MAG: flippase-like domain-containing protein [Saprospiraceae bacterium]|nr:flippase-like domain-containing protein [Saprospiraceae bacterium]